VVPGERSAENCKKVVQEVYDRTDGKGAMLLTSDAYAPYATAIEEVYGVWVQPERKPGPGRPPGPRRELPAGLVYATVCKKREKGRVVEVIRTVVFGMWCLLEWWLRRSGVSNTINTSFVERLNLTIRQHVAAVGRRVSTLCKGEAGLDQQLALYHGYYNFCLPHGSVRQPLPQPVPTNGTGSAKQWRPCTPAMAAGLTDHVWTLREVLLFRVPPWPQPAGV